jgi:pyruvate-ferredoxin/flavodoxin oxidoreductase
MAYNHRQQNLAVDSGHWPLFRFNPAMAKEGKNPLHLDSKKPSVPYREFIKSETRFNMLWHSHPEDAERFLDQAQREVNHRYSYYKQLSELDWTEAVSVAATKAKLTQNKTEA